MAPPDELPEVLPPAPGDGRDPWAALAVHTAARIALGRAGGSLRTASLLEFNVAHSQARDAVHAPFSVPGLAAEFAAAGLTTQELESGAPDRNAYLRRPDLGRRLSAASAGALRRYAAGTPPRDLAILVSDGLAAQATAHAVATVAAMTALLGAEGITWHPIFLVPRARVMVQDEVGEILQVRQSVIFLGERPGLSAPDSLGAYLTYEPRLGRTDADRNCLSNIRPQGLPTAVAARKLAQLLLDSRRLQVSGTRLRERSPELSGTSG